MIMLKMLPESLRDPSIHEHIKTCLPEENLTAVRTQSSCKTLIYKTLVRLDLIFYQASRVAYARTQVNVESIIFNLEEK